MVERNLAGVQCSTKVMQIQYVILHIYICLFGQQLLSESYKFMILDRMDLFIVVYLNT